MNVRDRTKERGGPKAAPLGTSTEDEAYYFLFFCVHFTVAEETAEPPPALKVVVTPNTHDFFEHLALR
jgi:hypothetical protein